MYSYSPKELGGFLKWEPTLWYCEKKWAVQEKIRLNPQITLQI